MGKCQLRTLATIFVRVIYIHISSEHKETLSFPRFITYTGSWKTDENINNWQKKKMGWKTKKVGEMWPVIWRIIEKGWEGGADKLCIIPCTTTNFYCFSKLQIRRTSKWNVLPHCNTAAQIKNSFAVSHIKGLQRRVDCTTI